MAKILVTGGAGYIGSHTVHFLLKHGHQVVVVDNLSRGHARSVPAGLLRVCDLRETEKITALLREERCEAVIHFAAYIAVGESTKFPELYFSNNTAGLHLIVRRDAGGGCEEGCVFVDSGFLRHPQRGADQRGPALAPHQPVRRVQGDGGEDSSRRWISTGNSEAFACATSMPAVQSPRQDSESATSRRRI